MLNRRRFLAVAAAAAVAPALPASPKDLSAWTVTVETGPSIDLNLFPRFEMLGYLRCGGVAIRNSGYCAALVDVPERLVPTPELDGTYRTVMESDARLVMLPASILTINRWDLGRFLESAVGVDDAEVGRLYDAGVAMLTIPGRFASSCRVTKVPAHEAELLW